MRSVLITSCLSDGRLWEPQSFIYNLLARKSSFAWSLRLLSARCHSNACSVPSPVIYLRVGHEFRDAHRMPNMPLSISPSSRGQILSKHAPGFYSGSALCMSNLFANVDAARPGGGKAGTDQSCRERCVLNAIHLHCRYLDACNATIHRIN